MQLPLDNYYAIQDISDSRGTQKTLAVVAEYDNRGEAEQDAFRRDLVNCSVYWETERDGKRYRVICPKTNVNSDAKDAL
jgi:hypothetical protein